MFNWTYAGNGVFPTTKCEVLCDFGKEKGYRILTYNDGFFDENGKGYSFNFDIKRYAILPKHCDEQF